MGDSYGKHRRSDLRHRYPAVASLLVACLLCGCGAAENAQTIGLKEPLLTTESYQPVKRGIVGDISVEQGTVVPMEYGQFCETPVTVEEILVEPGDEVKEKQPIARLRITELTAEYESLSGQLAQLDYERGVQEEISVLSLRIASLQKEASTGTEGNTASGEGGEASSVQIAQLKENERYDGLLYRYRRQRLTERLASLETALQDGTLYANHDGRVSYIKNLGVSLQADAMENIVVLADWTDVYVQINGRTIDQGIDEEDIWLLAGGEEYPLKERAYPEAVQLQAYVLGRYPYAAYDFTGEMPYEPGGTYPVCRRDKRRSEGLLINGECVRYDAEQAYVYVRTAEGNERRDITLGDGDRNYVEVLEGLSEGDQVLCSVTDRPPTDGLTRSVRPAESDVLSTQGEGSTVGIGCCAPDALVPCYSEISGTVTKVLVSQGQRVQKGDVLLTVDTGVGNAQLTELKYRVEDARDKVAEETRAYEREVKELRSQELSKEEESCRLKIARLNHEKSLRALQETLTGAEEDYARARKENDGAGKIKLRAGADGMITSFTVKKGDTIGEGELLYVSRHYGTTLLQTMFHAATEAESEHWTTDPEDFGVLTASKLARELMFREPTAEESAKSLFAIPLEQAVVQAPKTGQTLWMDADKTAAKGVCVGYINDTGKVYPDLSYNGNAGLILDGVWIDAGEKAPEVEAAGAKQEFSYTLLHIAGALVLPRDAVYEETDMFMQKRCYVWQNAESGWIKTYVTIYDQTGTDEVLILAGLREGEEIAWK